MLRRQGAFRWRGGRSIVFESIWARCCKRELPNSVGRERFRRFRRHALGFFCRK